MNFDQLMHHLTTEVRPMRGVPEGFKELAPKIRCADGASLSVQASWTHYCTPRQNIGAWTTVEVGFPSVEPPETWAPYFDGDWDTDDRCASVYGYVPVEVVLAYINEHGGAVNV